MVNESCVTSVIIVLIDADPRCKRALTLSESDHFL